MQPTLIRRRNAAARPLLAGLFVLCATAPVRAQEPFPGLDAYVAGAVAAWNVPGLSIAIVRNDSVVYAKGFGVLAAGSTKAVDAHTLFEIGSCSKAFTGALVAMLVSDGKMRFDDRVTDYLPTFRLADPVANAQVTIRDLLTHRTGIGRNELMWLGSGASRAELLHRVRFVQPESPFRSRYSYQNVMFLAAGEAAGIAGGSSWDALMAQRVFGPLQMTRSVTSSRGLTDPNVAAPHSSARDSVFVKPHADMDNIAPAGSILSSAHDMAQWVRFQLGDGEYQGKRLLNSGPFRETHTPQILAGGGGGGSASGERVTTFNTYGLGWQVQDYRGQLMWTHGGGTDGMSAMVGMLPDQKVGVVVLSNVASSSLPGLLMRWVFDRQLNAPLRDLAGEARARTLAQRTRGDSATAAQASQRRGGPAPLPLTAYAGTFADSLYGDATVAVEGSGLTLRRGEWYGPLEYWNGTNFRWTVPNRPVGQPPYIKFDVSADDRVIGLYFGAGDVTPLLRRRTTQAAPRVGGGS